MVVVCGPIGGCGRFCIRVFTDGGCCMLSDSESLILLEGGFRGAGLGSLRSGGFVLFPRCCSSCCRSVACSCCKMV